MSWSSSVVLALSVVICYFIGGAVFSEMNHAPPGQMPLCKASSPRAMVDLVDSIFVNATETRLEKLTTDADKSIALRAYWEIVLRTIDEEKIAGAEKIREDYLNRFEGFVEGRLKVIPPSFWTRALLRANAHHRANVFFRRELNDSPFYRTGAGVLCPKKIQIEADGKNWRIQIKKESFVLPSAAKEQSIGPLDAISVLVSDRQYYVAAYSDRCVPFNLFCIDKETEQIIWKSRVWAAGGLVQYTGVGYNGVDLVERENEILVFGAGDDAIYIEGFDKKDGSTTLRFGTSY